MLGKNCFVRTPFAGRLAALTILILAQGLGVSPVQAKVFHARGEIFDLAFPGADNVEAVDFFLTAQQRNRIQNLAASEIDSDFLTIYVGRQDDRVIGYAVLDTHVVRTLPETFLIVLNKNGEVNQTFVMAFHEPLEYMPHERWLALLRQRGLNDELTLGHGVVGLTGSTLSAHAVLGSVRRALAAHQVLIAASAEN
jgi:hypothetical protein